MRVLSLSQVRSVIARSAIVFTGAALAVPSSARGQASPVAQPPLDTAVILASARHDIDSANAEWFPALRNGDARALARAYADSGIFIGADGTITRGRGGVASLYAARFPRLTGLRAGGIVQQGRAVLGPTRIIEWGVGWLEMATGQDGAPATRTSGSYLTVWERETDGHWRIVRNLSFPR